jgi:hypothetical protein
MDSLVVEVMQKRLEREINEVLKRLELHVGKIEFNFEDKLALVIDLQSTASNVDLVS